MAHTLPQLRTQIDALDQELLALLNRRANLALEVSHFGYVLETGRVILSDSAPALRSNPEVRNAYLGG